MELVLAAYLGIATIALLAWIVWEHRTGAVDLLSTRNVCLAGLLIFQFSSGCLALAVGIDEGYVVEDFVGTGLKYSLMLTVWTVLFLWIYKKGWVADALARRVPGSAARLGQPALWALACMMTGAGAATKFGVQLPLVGVLSSYLALALTATAAGLAGWIWAPRLFNPVVAAMALGIVAVNAGIATYGEFGRRPLLGVGFGMLWGMYYSHWRYLPFPKMAMQAAAVGIIPLFAVALQTSVRSWEATTSTKAIVSEMQKSGSVGKGLMLLGTGQDTAGKSFFCLEYFPENEEYRPLASLWYFVVYPIPRASWPEKPYTLSNDIPRLARMPDVPHDGTLTIGPGLVGQAECDGGWPALVLYAFILAAAFRFFDRTTLMNIHNPLLAMPAGSCLGQIVGVARGDMAQFMWIFAFGTIGSWAVLFVLSKVLEQFNPAAITYVDEHDHSHDYADEGLVDPATAYDYEHEPASRAAY